MPQKRLNPALLLKMAKKTGKSEKYLGEQISRKAGRQRISSTAAQLVWARELGIGIANALQKLSPEAREEVRSAGAGPSIAPPRTSNGKRSTTQKRKAEPITAATIDTLLHDVQLRGRCRDLLRAKKHFDRVFREATTVLDDRLKKKTGITNMNPEKLVGKALNPSTAVLEVSADKAEQEGFHSICRGIMLAFRNKAHHSLSDKFTREDALKFCSFIDTVLGVIDQAIIHPDRV
jgi:uncharacterized protein (TIGR02391 family)